VCPRKFFFMMEILIRVSIDEKKMNWPKKNLAKKIFISNGETIKMHEKTPLDHLGDEQY
jgi:hypothetical protein